MVDDRMKYDRATQDRLISEMDGYYKDLDMYKDQFVAARDKLIAKAWEENSALETFKTQADSLLDELGDTHTKLQALRTAIDGAFTNAFDADKKVYNSF
ncbi:hypothetical protein ACWDYH_30495 [Nocardia goodfellowii]|uniref:WXG100 family type VII secretion target n=1 Tax=Nocardia goodfellowii TaxID=882446 RepID=A0ABS4Q6S1_9NOCA|nr:hypothetical protein [Nocardia goodfellowii]MBP2187398.1 hypothetical protein [Nocardia goodfellowii]